MHLLKLKKWMVNFFNTDFTYGITGDKRNQVFQPTEGYIATFTQSLPMIQDSSSIMNGLNISAYHDFSEDLIGSFKFYAKSIHGIDDDVRLLEKIIYTKEKTSWISMLDRVGPKDGDRLYWRKLYICI